MLRTKQVLIAVALSSIVMAFPAMVQPAKALVP